jgi:hypothetical protein
LWGITVSPTSTGGGAKPNLGDLTNTDTTDDGKNHIYGNTNTSTPYIAFYNNNVDDIMAQNNYWGSNNPDSVEATIFHQPDDASLGRVNYSDHLILPVKLVMFSGNLLNNTVTLNWRTGSENNSDHFIIERSYDGRTFHKIGKVIAAGNSSDGKYYSFDDMVLPAERQFYRLKLVDKDGTSKYSKVIMVRPGKSAGAVRLYPTVFSASQPLTTELVSVSDEMVLIQFISSVGRVLQQLSRKVMKGTNIFLLKPGQSLPAGMIQVRFVGKDLDRAVPVVKH